MALGSHVPWVEWRWALDPEPFSLHHTDLMGLKDTLGSQARQAQDGSDVSDACALDTDFVSESLMVPYAVIARMGRNHPGPLSR